MRAVNALPTSDLQARAARLVDELEAAVGSLDLAAALEVRAAVARLDQAIVSRVLIAALEAARKPAPPPAAALTLEEAAGRMGKSKSWLYHERKRLGMGHKVGGSLRFAAVDVERYLRFAATRKGRAS